MPFQSEYDVRSFPPIQLSGRYDCVLYSKCSVCTSNLPYVSRKSAYSVELQSSLGRIFSCLQLVGVSVFAFCRWEDALCRILCRNTFLIYRLLGCSISAGFVVNGLPGHCPHAMDKACGHGTLKGPRRTSGSVPFVEIGGIAIVAYSFEYHV